MYENKCLLIGKHNIDPEIIICDATVYRLSYISQFPIMQLLVLLPIAEFTRLLQWLSWLLVSVLLHGQAEAGVGGGCSNVVEVLHALQHCSLPAHIWHNNLLLLLHNTTEWSCVVVTLGFSTCNQGLIISYLIVLCMHHLLPLLDICLSLSLAAIAFNPEHLLFFWCLLTPELVLKPLPQC